MPERPALIFETFLALAQQQGFEMDIPHLADLFTEVQAMFRRIELLDRVDVGDTQPGFNFVSTDTEKAG